MPSATRLPMEVLYVLLILLLVTKTCADIAVRFGQPALVGELVGGILVGLAVKLFPDADLAIADLGEDRAFDALLDLAVFFLMLIAGIEMRPRDLTGVAKQAAPVAIVGLLLPLVLGLGLGWWWLPDSDWKLAQCLFLGVALAVTAVPVAVKVLMDLGALDTKVGNIVVAAAVIDDVLSLVLLAVLTSLLSASESVTGWLFLMIGVKVTAFFVIAVVAGRYVLPALGKWIRHVAVGHAEFTMVILFGLFLAVLAELLDMHFLIGAFTAGVVLTRKAMGEEVYSKLRAQFEAITLGFLAPIFFASIGMHLDLSAATEAPLFVGALLLLATIGKLAGAGLTARLVGLQTKGALAVGAAMNARGAVELIIADIALRAGLFDKPEPVPPAVGYMFSAVVIMAIVTTLLSPIMLRGLLGDSKDT